MFQWRASAHMRLCFDVNPHILLKLENTFSLEVAHMYNTVKSKKTPTFLDG